MKAGRKNLQRACHDGTAVTLAEGERIMQVVTLRGSNLIEVRALLQHRIKHAVRSPIASCRTGFLTLPCAVCRQVTDGKGVTSLALFPAKFQKSFWIKNGG